jgi:hypothetical protein
MNEVSLNAVAVVVSLRFIIDAKRRNNVDCITESGVFYHDLVFCVLATKCVDFDTVWLAKDCLCLCISPEHSPNHFSTSIASIINRTLNLR